MPEITSVERIREKLQEFEERIEGAIASAEKLSRIKVDAEKLLTDIGSSLAKADSSAKQIASSQSKMQELHREWSELKAEIVRGNEEVKQAGRSIAPQLDAFSKTIEKRLIGAEERLKQIGSDFLAGHTELLESLEKETRANVEESRIIRSHVEECSVKLEGHLQNVRNDLRSEVDSFQAEAQATIESRCTALEAQLTERVDLAVRNTNTATAEAKSSLQGQLDAFMAEVSQKLESQQAAMERQITDFLGKQHALVQNIGQQVDSYSRATQGLKADLAAVEKRLSDLSDSVSGSAGLATTQSSIDKRLTELAELVSGIRRAAGTKLNELKKTVDETTSRLNETTSTLNETIGHLRELPIYGKKFK